MPDDEGEAAAEMGIGIAIAFLFVGFILGFLVGARTRQISAKLKNIGKAVLSLHLLLKIKEAMAGMDDAEAMNEGDDDEADDAGGEDDTKKAEELMDAFMNSDPVDGLEDHPDVEISPVIMFQIKKAKEVQRLEKQKALLMAEGLTEAEAEERMTSLAESGGGVSDVRANPLAVLIAAGARVEAARGATSDEMVKKIELRRKQRNVNVFIQKTYEIDTTVKRAEAGDVGGSKGNKKSALDVARETKSKPVGGENYKRELKAVTQAKSARDLLKKFKIQDDLEKAAKKKKATGGVSATAGLEYGDGERRQAVGLDAADLAALLAEDGGEGEEGEEGAEGEEGFEGEEGEEGAD